MTNPKAVIRTWVDAFNRGDAEALAALYTEDAVNHQVVQDPVQGRAAIRAMFQREFAAADMTCIVENLFADGEWAMLEWRDPAGLRGCGFFQIVEGKIQFQRGYWDRLSFFSQQEGAAAKEPARRWLEWARQIQALSQSGLAYGGDEYDRERYRRLQEIAAEIVQTHTTLPETAVLENFQMQAGYATPKVGVRGAVVREGQILLVRERADGLWCMPGGWADAGERPSQMVQREVEEESGFAVRAHKLIGVYDANREQGPVEYYHTYKIVFLCEIVGGAARPGVETTAVAFFAPDDLPPLSHNRTNERQIREALAHAQNGARPAAFD